MCDNGIPIGNKTNDLSQKQCDCKDLEKQLEELKLLAEENMAGWKRNKADYLNLQKDIEKNRQAWSEFALIESIKGFLPIWQSFDGLLKDVPTDIDDKWLQGVKQIKKMMDDFFAKQNITRISTVGEKFNPEWHEAVGKELKEGFKSDIIISEIAPGYKINNKLIISPKVIIAE